MDPTVPAPDVAAPDRAPLRAHAQRRRSLVFSLLAVLLVVGMLPLALMGWQVAASLTDDLSVNQQDMQLDKAERIEQDIARYIQGHFDRLDTTAVAISRLADSQALRGMSAAAGAKVFTPLLEDYLAHEGALEVRLVSAVGSDDLTLRAQTFYPEAVSQDVMPRVRDASDKGRRGSRYLSNPFVSSRPLPYVMCVIAVPLMPADGLAPADSRPVLVAVISMAPVQQVVQPTGDTSRGYTVFVLDDTLRVFAHTNFRSVLEGIDVSENPLVQEFQQFGLSPMSKTFDQQTPAGSVRSVIGTFRPLALVGHRWGVFVEVDSEIGFFQVTEMRRKTVSWGVVAFALAVVFGIVFSWRITSPIHELTESTRRVAGGEYGRRVKVRSNNEIGMLADNFNVMSDNIRRTIDDLKRQQEINDQLFLASIRSLAAAIDARDPYTRGHSERVTRYARTIARQLDLSPEQVRSIEIGALLHDVGKIGIEDRILRKPAALTPEEFEIMKTHPEKGGVIMEPISSLREATETIIHHHERWDGAGYPSGLRGEEIPLGARVVNVADTFDAMTTNRPYQRAMTFAAAAKKIGEFSGKACDPVVVRAFQAAFDAGLLGQLERASTG